jgi:hypothetical protein
MFTFFHRRKKIVVDCFTSDALAYEYAPLVRGPKAFPDWWKRLPLNDAANDPDYTIETHKNMRKCYGFLEIYKRSIVLPCWTDIRFKVTPKDGYTWNKSSGPAPEEHSKTQYEGGFTDYYHSKMSSPWHLKEKSGINFLYTASTWNLENYNFLIPPGMLEFKINHATNVNILMPKKKENYFFFIPIGKPLVHMIPLQDDVKLEIRNHLITDQEIKKISPPLTMRGIYPLFDIKDKAKKCPFGF